VTDDSGFRTRVALNAWQRALVRPLISFFYGGTLPTRLTWTPAPDEPTGSVPGPDPDRVLVVGGIAGAGVGVRSHKLGVASTLAQGLSRASGRGAQWRAVPLPAGRIGTTAAALSERVDLRRYDVIVFFPGVYEALHLSSPTRWAGDYDAVLRHLTAHAASDATIVTSPVPQVSDRVRVPAVIRAFVREHTRLLNLGAARIAAQYPGVLFTAMPTIDGRMMAGDLFSYAKLYRIWGNHLAELVSRERDAVGGEPHERGTRSQLP
jgi:hypothetical protein